MCIQRKRLIPFSILFMALQAPLPPWPMRRKTHPMFEGFNRSYSLFQYAENRAGVYSIHIFMLYCGSFMSDATLIIGAARPAANSSLGTDLSGMKSSLDQIGSDLCLLNELVLTTTGRRRSISRENSVVEFKKKQCLESGRGILLLYVQEVLTRFI